MTNKSNAALIVGGLLLGVIVMSSTRPKLRYFSPSEFGIWWAVMDGDLLVKLDEFRHLLGVPVEISKADGAMGRPEAPNSQHYPNPTVRAVDVMPKGATLERAYEIARRVGFTGIGLYPDWKPRPGLHLDVRKDRTAMNPALWAGVMRDGKQIYTGINEALA